MKKQLLLVFIVLLVTGCGAPELLPTEIPALPNIESTATIPATEEIEIEDPEIEVDDPDLDLELEPEQLPITPEPITLPTIESAQPAPPELPSSPSEQMDALVEQAREELAQRLSIPVTQITLVQVEDVTWSDSSMGCPQKGMAYLQVMTPGYLILLEAGGKEYEYHAGIGTGVFYCENPSTPADGGLEE